MTWSPDPPAPLPPSQMLVLHRHTWSEAATVEGDEGIAYF